MKPITVAQLNSYVKRILSGDPVLSNVSVEGEISGVKYHPTGVYFTLKDASSKLSCYISPSTSRNLSVKLEDGLKAVAHGSVSVYERGGTYSLYIKDIEPAGIGALAEAFEKLKKKLEAEGLFDEAHKKPIPEFPKKVAVVTSPTGAAVQDIKKIITAKNDFVDILIYPVLVQGPGAPADIADAIRFINANMTDIDVMIVGRGGGSIEELWAFNEEIVARAIYDSDIPVISAVGHETDFTISDFVADRRAETPTAAANMAVPDTNELRMYLEDKKTKLLDILKQNIASKEERVRLAGLDAMKREMLSKIAICELKCKGFRDTLEQLNPLSIMDRGYAALTDERGKLITSAKSVAAGDKVSARVRDGEISMTVDEVKL
ncbi:MAG: exodeoxyribonuclease VII large subunit [Firmicutes bacterium]|nr:exodeoxyribonuclease VII large subunit [Bacillota bacterium]